MAESLETSASMGSSYSESEKSEWESAVSTADEVTSPGTTHRYLVLLRRNSLDEGVHELTRILSISTLTDVYYADREYDAEVAAAAQITILAHVSVAIVKVTPVRLLLLILAMESGESTILEIERARTLEGEQETISSAFESDYLKGYRDGVNSLTDRLLRMAPSDSRTLRWNEDDYTWGLQATKVDQSAYSGRGIRLAVLDTGLDFGHPDFTGRSIVSETFIAGEPVDDRHGHGTHSVGTACGPRVPAIPPRYGVACDAELYVGKVLNNQCKGEDPDLMAGINWAIANECQIISMSLGVQVAIGDSYSPIFEAVARDALENKRILLIAAAGNTKFWPRLSTPVKHPANCPSIMAVAAVDKELEVANFSNAGLNPNGGEVNIAGPGVAVRSSWLHDLGPGREPYASLDGTSRSTPHVAGIAALLAEKNSNSRGWNLWNDVVQTVQRIPAPARDVGAGLVQAP